MDFERIWMYFSAGECKCVRNERGIYLLYARDDDIIARDGADDGSEPAQNSIIRRGPTDAHKPNDRRR